MTKPVILNIRIGRKFYAKNLVKLSAYFVGLLIQVFVVVLNSSPACNIFDDREIRLHILMYYTLYYSTVE